MNKCNTCKYALGHAFCAHPANSDIMYQDSVNNTCQGKKLYKFGSYYTYGFLAAIPVIPLTLLGGWFAWISFSYIILLWGTFMCHVVKGIRRMNREGENLRIANEVQIMRLDGDTKIGSLDQINEWWASGSTGSGGQ